MEQELDSKKINARTPRRTLGMSRMTPRRTITPQEKRQNQPDTNLQTTPKIHKIDTRFSQSNEDNSYRITPTKRRKVSTDNLDENIVPDRIVDVASGSQNSASTSKKTAIELKAEILQMKSRLDKHEKYQNKKKDLTRMIELWCIGGKEALKTLQKEIKSEQEIELIQTHLNLPRNIFDFT